MKPVRSHLSHLENSGLISIATLQPELEYLFRHALVQDAVYDTLFRRDRKRLHLAVGEVLEATHADLPEHAATLAYHFHQAEEHERAHHYYWMAGEAALANYANAEAQQHFQSALALSTTEPQRLQALNRLGTALHKGRRISEALPIYREAIELAYQLGDFNALGSTYAALSDAMWYQGDSPGALAVCHEGLALFEGEPDSEGLALLLSQMASVSHFTGTGREGIKWARRAQQIANDLGLLALQADNLITLGMLIGTQDLEAARSYYREGIVLAELQRLVRTAARGYVNFGVMLAGVADFVGANEQVLRAREIGMLLGDAGVEIVATLNIVENCLWLGQLDEADYLIQAELTPSQSTVQPAWALSALNAYSGLATCHRGQWEDGFEILRRSLKEARQAASLQIVGTIGVFFADFLSQRRQFEEAEALLLEVIPLSDQALGLGPIYPRCVMAGVYAAQGRVDEAAALSGEAQFLATQTGYPLESVDLRMAEARVAAAQERWQDALAEYAAAEAWCDQRSMRPAQGQVYLGWADALRRVGERHQAAVMLNKAKAIYAAMQADGYIRLIDQQLASLSQETTP